MRVVITGALGYVGSRLMRADWPSCVEDVVLLDNRAAQGIAALLEVAPTRPMRFIEGDIRTFDFTTILDQGDVVVHLAAITGSEASVGDRALVDDVNVEATGRVARACAERGAALLFLSSTSVYGGYDGVVEESTDLEHAPPDNHYALSKLRAERSIDSASAHLRFAILRCGTMYGPSAGMRFHTAITKFCWQASTAQPITVWRTAMDQRRPYLDLDDALGAIRFVIERDLFDRGTLNAVTETATVRDAIACLREAVPGLTVEIVDSPAMTVRSQDVSCDRLRRAGFTCRGNLRRGIARTLAALDGVRGRVLVHDRR